MMATAVHVRGLAQLDRTLAGRTAEGSQQIKLEVISSATTPAAQVFDAAASKRKAEDFLEEGDAKRVSRAETPDSHAPSQAILGPRLSRQQPPLPLGDGQLQGLLGLLDLIKQDEDRRTAATGASGAIPSALSSPPPLMLKHRLDDDNNNTTKPEPAPQNQPSGSPRRRTNQQGVRQPPHPCWALNGSNVVAGRAPGDAKTRQRGVGGKGAVDTRPRPFLCRFEGCGYAATKLRYVTEHERTHTGVKPYECTWEGCNYRSSGSGHMARHIRTHTGDRPYKCAYPDCHYAASQSGHLRTHLRKHTGERPFKCPAPGCSYAASRGGHLRRHMKIHESWYSGTDQAGGMAKDSFKSA